MEDNCLRLFLDYYGLELLWSWITDSKEGFEDVKIMVSVILCIINGGRLKNLLVINFFKSGKGDIIEVYFMFILNF